MVSNYSIPVALALYWGLTAMTTSQTHMPVQSNARWWICYTSSISCFCLEELYGSKVFSAHWTFDTAICGGLLLVLRPNFHTFNMDTVTTAKSRDLKVNGKIDYLNSIDKTLSHLTIIEYYVGSTLGAILTINTNEKKMTEKFRPFTQIVLILLSL